MDLDGTFAAVVAGLERATTRKSKTSYQERLVSGFRGGHELDVLCAYYQRDGVGYAWTVNAEVKDAPPLLFRLTRRGGNDAEAAERGDLTIAPTGDAAFDAAWTIEGAPRATVKRVFSPRARDAMTKLATTRITPKSSDDVHGEGTVHVDGGKVGVSSWSGPFDAGTVLAGIDLVVALCDELTAVRDERRRSPPPATTLAAERADIEAARAARPKTGEERIWRRMSTRTRNILIVAVAGILGYALVDYVRQALTFLPHH
jgi:hypothetical protein